MKNNILEIRQLDHAFEGLQLLKGVNLTVQRGTINCLIGKNGSGKTTLFNIIGGHIRPDKGNIVFKGTEITHKAPFEITRTGIGKMWQFPKLFPNHTVLENLLIGEFSHPGDKFLNNFIRFRAVVKREEALKEKAFNTLERLSIGGKAEKKLGSLSLGEQKMVSVGALLMGGAELLLLDEPFSAINPVTIDKLLELFKELRGEGKTIFMIEHKLKFALPHCDEVFKIENQSVQQSTKQDFQLAVP